MHMYGGTRGHTHFLRSNLIKTSSFFPTPAAFRWCLLWKTVDSPTERTLLSFGARVADTVEVWKRSGGITQRDAFEGNGTCEVV